MVISLRIIFSSVLLKMFICFRLRPAVKVYPDISEIYISVQVSSRNPYCPTVYDYDLVFFVICLKISEKLITNISKSVISTTIPNL